MSKKEKLFERFKSKPKDFTWNELTVLLNYFGYDMKVPGKAGGSRTKFISRNGHPPIFLHKPHPHPVLKSYQIEFIFDTLKNEGLII